MYYPAGGQTYNLQSSIGSTDTTITLSSFLEPVTDTPYTMVLLNTEIVFATIAPKTSSSEFISFTGITQNADGTATLTGVTRGLAKKYPFTASASYRLPHSGQSQFILSDAPQVFVKYGALDNDEVITGFWEGPDPITAQGLVTRDWILALINGGTISQNQVVEAGIAGETLVAGNLIYFDETQNEWMKTDADTLATLFNVKLGIAMGAGTNGASITGGVLTYGTYTTSGLTQGDLCYASNTAGGINSGTSGTIPRVIGIAKDATTLYFDPNFQNRLYDYAVDSVGTDAYAVTMTGGLSVPFVGMEINFKAGTANTGACTIAINGGSAIAIVKGASTALETGDIVANQIVKILYNGTAWQVLSAIPTAAMNQTTNSLQYMEGALSNSVVKSYFNMQLPFILWVGAVAADTTTTFANWLRSGTDANVIAGGGFCDMVGTGLDYLSCDFFTGASNNMLQFNSVKIVILDWWAKLPASGTGSVNMGWSSANNGVEILANSAYSKITFIQVPTGELYAVVSKASVGVSSSDISSGLTLTNWNNYRIEWTQGTDAKFYVNGVLKATLSGANLDSAATGAPAIVFGRTETSLFRVTAPNLSLQM